MLMPDGKAMDAATRGLRKMGGRRLVDMAMVGQDPSEGCITYVSVGELDSPKEDRYSYHMFRDWTHSDSASMGYAIGQGYYMMTYEEAMAEATATVRDYRARYAWNDPYTGQRLPKR